MQVRDGGGVPEPLTTPDEDSQEQHWDPHFLPGGETLLFTIRRPGESAGQIAALSLESGQYEILTTGFWPQYSAGHLVFERAPDALWAVPFDPGRIEVIGEPVAVLEGVRCCNRFFSISGDGTLVYSPRRSEGGSESLVWVDRDGQERPLPFEAQRYRYPRISPQGDRLAVAVSEGDRDLWVLDLDRGSRSRITFGGNNQFFPIWTPEGDQLTFADGPTAPNTLYLADADGSGGIDTLLQREGAQFPTSWSRDGSVLAFYERDSQTSMGRDIWVLPVGGDPEPFLVTPFEERAPVFSPDGRWLAYVSNESGQEEIYVTPYPGPGPRTTISTAGGTEPVWSQAGSELFYRESDQLMVVAVDLGETFRGGTPQSLFADPYLRDPNNNAAPNYDVAPDGQGFVMVRGDVAGQDVVILVENWFEELRQRMGN